MPKPDVDTQIMDKIRAAAREIEEKDLLNEKGPVEKIAGEAMLDRAAAVLSGAPLTVEEQMAVDGFIEDAQKPPLVDEVLWPDQQKSSPSQC